jgi:hypothetical protein
VPFSRWKSVVEPEAADDNIAHVPFTLSTYKNTLTIHNTYSFSTATVVARTHLNVALYIHWSILFILKRNEQDIIINVPYILESNTHSVFGDFLNGKKKLVRDSNPHLSFHRPLPTGRLIE